MSKRTKEDDFTFADWFKVLGIGITLGAGLTIGSIVITLIVYYLKH